MNPGNEEVGIYSQAVQPLGQKLTPVKTVHKEDHAHKSQKRPLNMEDHIVESDYFSKANLSR